MDVSGRETVAIRGACVRLSDRRTQSSWEVDVADYRIGTVPVTRGLYASVMADAASSAPDSAEGQLPAESVSWWDALRFCNALSARCGRAPAYRLTAAPNGSPAGESASAEALPGDGYRLPTEAEWEHACRAGTSGPRYGPLDAVAWYRGNSGEQLRPVAGKTPNAWGLYDTLGGVWEWCWDRYDPEVYGEYRVLRGGGWFDDHWSCRASVRRRSHPTLQLDDVGFRIARSGSD